MASIKLTSSEITPNTVKLHGAQVTYSWKSNIYSKAYEHSFQNTESQFNGWENPLFNLTFYIPANTESDEGYITWEQWNTLVKQKITSSNQITLAITSGALDSDKRPTLTKEFKSYADSETSTGKSEIPVVIKSYSVKFDAGDSVNGYFWAINAQLQETK